MNLIWLLNSLIELRVSYLSSVQSLSCVWLFVTPWLQHIRPPCPSLTPRVYSNSCPLSRWCHPTTSFSVVPFSSHLTKRGPLEKRMANHFSIIALRTPWRVWKGKKIGHWKMNSPDPQVPSMLLEISGEITPERMKRWNQSRNNIHLWISLMIEAKSDAVKSNIS